MDNDALVPVYLSFRTFLGAITNLRENGLPDKVDKSVFGSRSGADQSQIISAFKFLGLIDKDNNTQQSLKDLVNSQEKSKEEKTILGQILADRYSKVFEHNLKTATPMQVETTIGEYGSKGTTKDRAVRFFIKTLEYCEIEISPRLTEGTRTRRRTSTNNPKNGGAKSPRPRKKTEDKYTKPVISSQAMKTINLPDAKGELSVTGTFNPFELVGGERELVFGIIDLMEEYEKKAKSSS